MARLIFRLISGILPVLFVTTMLVYAAGLKIGEPTAREIHDFFIPSDCPSPCFMGIRPGTTTIQEALAILRASTWVAEVNDRGLKNQDGLPAAQWIWSANAPHFMDDYASGAFVPLTNQVMLIAISPTLRLGDIFSALGPSEQLSVSDALVTVRVIFERNRYLNDTLTFESAFVCPVTPKRRFEALVKVTISLRPIPHEGYDDISKVCK